MRRMWAAGAAVVMCLAFTAVAVSASVGPMIYSDVTRVTGTENCDDAPPGPPYVCAYTASDPRVTGTVTYEIVAEPDLGGGDYLVFMLTTLDGPDGSWVGHRYVLSPGLDKSGLPRDLWDLSGTGAYEGWTYLAWGSDPSGGNGHNEHVGIIYQGTSLSDLAPTPGSVATP